MKRQRLNARAAVAYHKDRLVEKAWRPWAKWAPILRQLRVAREQRAFEVFRKRLRAWAIYERRRLEAHEVSRKRKALRAFVGVLKQRIAAKAHISAAVARIGRDGKTLRAVFAAWRTLMDAARDYQRVQRDAKARVAHAFRAMRAHAKVSALG